MSRQANPLALAVLATLLEGPAHPYALARLLRHRGKDQSIKIRYGSLYTVVKGLADRGLVEAGGTAQEGRRPERTVYRLTPAGREELFGRLRELVAEPVKEYPLFEAALSLMAPLGPDEVTVLLSERLRRLDSAAAGTRADLVELTKGQGMPRLFLLEAEYALAMREAEAAWVRGLLRELEDGTLEGVDAWRAFLETRRLPEEFADREWMRRDVSLREEIDEVDEGGHGT